jgi:hypothetical protein
MIFSDAILTVHRKLNVLEFLFLIVYKIKAFDCFYFNSAQQ